MDNEIAQRQAGNGIPRGAAKPPTPRPAAVDAAAFRDQLAERVKGLQAELERDLATLAGHATSVLTRLRNDGPAGHFGPTGELWELAGNVNRKIALLKQAAAITEGLDRATATFTSA